jgi:hypothetical protein
LAGTLALALITATDLQAQPRAMAAQRLPEWAGCVSGAAGSAVMPVPRLTALTDKALVTAVVGRVFGEREKEQRVSAPNLAGARLSIDFLYAAGQGAARVYYYEASKTIPDAEGILRVSVAGWLRGDGAAQRSLGSKSELHWAELADDDGGDQPVIPDPAPIPDAAAALVPLGVLIRAGEHTWVMKRQIGRGTVLVYDIGATGVQLRPAAAGKGC